MKGFVINSHRMSEYLDDARSWPVFEAAEALAAPLYLPPAEPGSQLAGPFPRCGLSGRSPRLRLLPRHLGEGLPFWLRRIENR